MLCFLPPRSAASLHSRDELFATAPEDPVDSAMEEASDDEDDAPTPDLIDMQPASGVCTPDVQLGALHRPAPGGDQYDCHRPKKNKKMPLLHITSSLCCLSCADVSCLSVVVTVGVLPRHPDSDKPCFFFFSVASKRVLRQDDLCVSALNVRVVQIQTSAALDRL